MKAAVSMSGGVDSSVAVHLMMNMGYDCIGMTLLLHGEYCPDDADRIAEKFGITCTHIAEKDLFGRCVIEKFVCAYEEGTTPNPCVICNRNVKFPLLLDFAEKNGCDTAVTGHYARIEKCGSRFVVKKGIDASKDQSYMLWNLTQDMLSGITLPLGVYTKNEIRDIARETGLFVAGKRDSQDICFIPDGDFAGFIERFRGRKTVCGDFINTSGEVIGRHNGQLRYTVGQNRGLGIAVGHKIYVLEKDAKKKHGDAR